jgi:hypothetical protein
MGFAALTPSYDVEKSTAVVFAPRISGRRSTAT